MCLLGVSILIYGENYNDRVLTVGLNSKHGKTKTQINLLYYLRGQPIFNKSSFLPFLWLLSWKAVAVLVYFA